MPSIAQRIDALAEDARELAMDAEFRASFAHSAGHLTLSHVSLHSAKLAAERLLTAIEQAVADADAFVKVPA